MKQIIIRQLGQTDYQPTWQAMKQFVHSTHDNRCEEIWFTEHPPVYTLGQTGQKTHLLQETSIPVIHSDRGGQITYHGPGQIIAYIMINIKQRAYGLRHFVRYLEQAIINTLADYNIVGLGDICAPGVYINGEKIAALGLRVRHGWTYHGISLNVNMDLSPFDAINPCGYSGLKVTQISNYHSDIQLDDVRQNLTQKLQIALNNGKK